jgi:CheY-like chemotaxis protein
MIINGYGEELQQALGPTNPLRSDAAEILTASQRISSIAGKLTEFARKPMATASPACVSDMVQGMEASLAQAAGERVRLEMTPIPSAVWAATEPAQLAEVILTLASAEHESAKDRTRLTVSCGTETLAERLPLATLAPGQYAAITLRDDGLGLDAAKLAGVFDPSVSTAKPEGFAMARSYGLVRQWGGDIACVSEPRRGSTFTIFLPLIETEKPAAPAVPVRAPIVAAVPVSAPAPVPEPLRETVLVVDDEAGIRGLMRKILRRERYDVLEAATAEEAVQLAATHKGRIHLLLTDVMLPGMLGPELARKLYASDEKLKVLYISGYTPDEAVRAGAYPPGAKFLAKPFTLGALLDKVRETLG